MWFHSVFSNIYRNTHTWLPYFFDYVLKKQAFYIVLPYFMKVFMQCEWSTYSTCLDHSGGLLNVMNTQLVKIVHMMIMLNNVGRS